MLASRKKVSEQRIRFSVAGLELEGALHMPSGETLLPAVVCHPHPLFGGEMSNNVVSAICNALAQAGIAAFRFNFRGVGGSQGSFAEGVGEQEDVKAALAFVSSITGIDKDRIGLVGYSFGAMVALPVALQGERVQALALISPPLSSSNWEQVKGYLGPKLFLCGSEDLVVSCSELQHFSQQLPPPSRFEIIPGADHFWWGYEGEVARRVSAFFSTYLQST
jgi:hypothetical protein